jgi:hypothetical protein
VTVEKGIFNVLLGSVNPIPDTVFPGDVRYLGVKVGGDPEMSPRKAIVSVAYAYRSGDDGDWTINGDNIYRLDGNVGIGTANPQGLLQVGEPFIVTLAEDVGISHATDPEYSPDAKLEIVPGIETNRDLLMLSSTADADGDVLIAKNNGNVGIGTTTPEHTLHVVGEGKGIYSVATWGSAEDRPYGVKATLNTMNATHTGGCFKADVFKSTNAPNIEYVMGGDFDMVRGDNETGCMIGLRVRM